MEREGKKIYGHSQAKIMGRPSFSQVDFAVMIAGAALLKDFLEHDRRGLCKEVIGLVETISEEMVGDFLEKVRPIMDEYQRYYEEKLKDG